MKQLGLTLVMLLLVGCADLPTFGRSADTDAAASTSSDVSAPDAPADTGYVFDDESPKPPVDDTAQSATTEPTPVEPKAGTTTAAPTPAKPDRNAAARLACARQKGRLTKTPAGFFVCVTETGQGQKSCSSAKQCDGVCLARSGTCSPFKPLIGCNEVITSQGGMQTLCID